MLELTYEILRERLCSDPNDSLCKMKALKLDIFEAQGKTPQDALDSITADMAYLCDGMKI